MPWKDPHGGHSPIVPDPTRGHLDLNLQPTNQPQVYISFRHYYGSYTRDHSTSLELKYTRV